MKSFISKILAVFALVLVADVALGADSKWTNGGTFTSSITLNESVTIPTGKTVTINGDLYIKPNGKSNINLTVNGTLKVEGSIYLQEYILSILLSLNILMVI